MSWGYRPILVQEISHEDLAIFKKVFELHWSFKSGSLCQNVVIFRYTCYLPAQTKFSQLFRHDVKPRKS